MRTGSPALREHLTKLNTSVRFLGAIAERATQALSTQALHKFERGVGWLMVLPSALCIGAVEVSRNTTIDDASLAPGHKLGQTVNFLAQQIDILVKTVDLLSQLYYGQRAAGRKLGEGPRGLKSFRVRFSNPFCCFNSPSNRH